MLKNLDMVKNVFLEGERLYMRPVTENDLDGNYLSWLNDSEVCKYNSHAYFPNTPAKMRSYFDSTQVSDRIMVLAVIDKESNTHIGNISLQAINWVNRSAEIAFLLGEKEFWGKGYMEEAGKLLIKHGFENLGLHRIHCGTVEENIGMNRLSEKLGMKKEGTQRDAFFKQNRYYNVVNYALINPSH